MYKHLGTSDLIPEIQQMLITKKHIHLTKTETYNLLKIHFGTMRRMMAKEDALWWFGRFKIMPNVSYIMERKVFRKERSNNKYIQIKQEYDEHTDGRSSSSPI